MRIHHVPLGAAWLTEGRISPLESNVCMLHPPKTSTAEGGFWITTEALPHVTFSRKSSVLRDERSYI